MAAPDATRQMNFRLTDADMKAIDRIIELGFASDRTSAVKIALQVAPAGLALWARGQILTMANALRELSEELQREVARGGVSLIEVDLADVDPALIARFNELRDSRAHGTPFRRRRAREAMQSFLEEHPEFKPLLVN